MIIRIKSAEGQPRIDIQPSDTPRLFAEKVAASLNVDLETLQFFSDQSMTKIIHLNVPTMAKTGLKHGDMVHVKCGPSQTTNIPSKEHELDAVNPLLVKQMPIDDYLEKQKGLILRGRSNFCQHTASGMCDFCMPLEPYDAKYLEENKIKHMSYHAYLRQVTTRSKTPAVTHPQFMAPLDEPDFKVKTPCPSRSHGPYPEGICTKCQPSAASLQSQSFRMVDHLEFESPALIDQFLKFWRQSGYQRFGYMYGRYEPYSEIPLGVKAIVSAIYEPPQQTEPDSIQVDMNDPQDPLIEEFASLLGLTRIGIIYSDLLDDGTGTGNVICKRHAESYFLSSGECIFSGYMQHKHPLPCKYSRTGKFGSRFMTCVLTGNEENQIDISSFQISNIGMAMIRDDIIEACLKPSLMRVKPSTDTKYVPEVFYKYKNEYGIMVQEAAKPTFPVDYLLVTSSHGFPSNPNPLFKSFDFPIEHRGGLESQSMEAVGTQLRKTQTPEALLKAISDFHLLFFLMQSHIFNKDQMKILCEAVVQQSVEKLVQITTSDSWQTLVMLANEAPIVSPTQSAPTATSDTPWECQYCTFLNMGRTDCEMCGLPR